MTTTVDSTTGRQLDFTGDSIQLTTRKGADLLWVHRFRDSDDNPLDISGWDFTRDVADPSSPMMTVPVSGGAVRNGTSTGAATDVLRDFNGEAVMNNLSQTIPVPNGEPLTVGIDIVKIDTNPGPRPLTTLLRPPTRIRLRF